MRKIPWNILYHVFLGSILISLNIYFFIFVHYKYDLSPNFALAILTFPFAYMEIKKAFQLNKKTLKFPKEEK